MIGDYDGGDDLADYIEGAVASFEDDRDDYWREQDEPLHYATDLTARQMVAAANDLTLPDDDSVYPDIPWAVHFKAAEHEKMRDGVMESIQLALAQQAPYELRDRALRCKELTLRVLAERPALPVLKYVRRLTRCYIAGFYPECVILCRGVMENAVKQQFGRKKIPIPANEDGKSTMWTILQAAERLSWLSAQARKDAWEIWHRGSKAVHEDIEVTTDAMGTIMMTIGVLAELCREVE